MTAPAGLRAKAPAITRHPLDRLLRPASVAVIGASPDPTKRGHRAVRALRDRGFGGRIIPVHPDGGELLGLPVARGPRDLDAPPDLAVICTPAATVPQVLETWGAAGTGGAIVLAAGFGESGASGSRLEAELRSIAARTGIRVIGPNTSGILNVPLGLDLMGLEVTPGLISFVGQSGNIALALATEAARLGVGFAFMIGLGNETDVGFHECLDFLAADEGTRAIVVHAEGFRNGAAFLAAARRAAAIKPVAMLKGARTERGGIAARSHTGAIAGSYAALRAGLRQAGVIEVLRTDELLPVAATLATQPAAAPSRGIVVLSDGGGHATIAVDDLLQRGLTLAALGAETSERLRALLGPSAAVVNPIDLAGAADRDPLVFARALEIITGDESVATVLVAGLFGGYAIRFAESLAERELEAARRLPDIARGANIALIVHSLYADDHPAPLRVLRDAGVPVLGSLETACRCAGAPIERGLAIERLRRLPLAWPAGAGDGAVDAPLGAAAESLRAARREGRTVLLEPEARALAAAHGVPLVPAELIAVEELDGTGSHLPEEPARSGTATFAVRVVSPSAPHKSEAGGVMLDVAPSAIARASAVVCDAVRAWCDEHDLEPDVRGVLVSPMLARPVAELLAGIVRDPQLGPVLTVGAGGTRVELHRDVAMRVLPIGADDVREMLGELRMAPLLAGHRGTRGANVDAIVRAVLALAGCALAHPELAELEVNPLFAYEDRAVAVDVRGFLR